MSTQEFLTGASLILVVIGVPTAVAPDQATELHDRVRAVEIEPIRFGGFMSEASHAANGTAKNSARAMPTIKHLLFAFSAGFIAVLVFQQGLRAALVAGGAGTATPYSLAPTAVSGVPQVLDRAFWGGVWGILLVMVESRVRVDPPTLTGSSLWRSARCCRRSSPGSSLRRSRARRSQRAAIRCDSR